MLDSGVSTWPPRAANSPYASFAANAPRAATPATGKTILKKCRGLIILPCLAFSRPRPYARATTLDYAASALTVGYGHVPPDRAENYCGWAGLVTPFVTGACGERESAAPGPALPGGACAPSAPRLGMKISMFVCARTPVSPGFSMLDPGVETCPVPGETCA